MPQNRLKFNLPEIFKRKFNLPAVSFKNCMMKIKLPNMEIKSTLNGNSPEKSIKVNPGSCLLKERVVIFLFCWNACHYNLERAKQRSQFRAWGIVWFSLFTSQYQHFWNQCGIRTTNSSRRWVDIKSFYIILYFWR